MKILVVYYSHGGNNKFLAQKIAQDCNADIVEIIPRLKGFGFVLISSLLKVSFGIRKLNVDIKEYNTVILCGPIYIGQLISPLLDFIKKNQNIINKFYFATCCGGGETLKDTKFGYNTVINKVKLLMNNKFIFADAFPVDLIVPDDLKGNGEEIMKIKLSNETFKGEIVEKYNNFIKIVKQEKN